MEKSVQTFPWELLPPNPSQEDVDKVYGQNTDKLWSVMNQLYRKELEAEQWRVQQINKVEHMHTNAAMHTAAMPSPVAQAVVIQPVSTLPAAMQVVAEAAVASLDALPAVMLSTVALPEAMQQVEAAPANNMQAGPRQPHQRVVTAKATTARETVAAQPMVAQRVPRRNRGNGRSASIL